MSLLFCHQKNRHQGIPPLPNNNSRIKMNNSTASSSSSSGFGVVRQRRKAPQRERNFQNQTAKQKRATPTNVSSSGSNNKSRVAATINKKTQDSSKYMEVVFIFWLFVLMTCLKLMLLMVSPSSSSSSPSPSTGGTCPLASAAEGDGDGEGSSSEGECGSINWEENGGSVASSSSFFTVQQFRQYLLEGNGNFFLSLLSSSTTNSFSLFLHMIVCDLVLWYGAYFICMSFHYYCHSNDSMATHSGIRSNTILSKKSTRYNTMISFLLIVLNPGILLLGMSTINVNNSSSSASSSPYYTSNSNKALLGILLLSLGCLLRGNTTATTTTTTSSGANNNKKNNYYHYVGLFIYGVLLSCKRGVMSSSYHAVIMSLGPFYFCYLLERYCLTPAVVSPPADVGFESTNSGNNNKVGNKKNGEDATTTEGPTTTASTTTTSSRKRFLPLPFISLIVVFCVSVVLPHLIVILYGRYQAQQRQQQQPGLEDVVLFDLDEIKPALLRSLLSSFVNIGDSTTTNGNNASTTTVAVVPEPNNIWMIYKLMQLVLSYIGSYFGISKLFLSLPNVTPLVCNCILFCTMIPAIEMVSKKLTNIKLLQGVAYCCLCVYMLAYNHDDNDNDRSGGNNSNSISNGNDYHEMAIITCMSIMSILVVGRQKRRQPSPSGTSPPNKARSQGTTATTSAKLKQQQQAGGPVPPMTTSSSSTTTTKLMQQESQLRKQQLQHNSKNRQHHTQRHEKHSMLMDIHNLLFFQLAAWGIISLLFPLTLGDKSSSEVGGGEIPRDYSTVMLKLVLYGTYLCLTSHVLHTPPKWMSAALQYVTIVQVLIAVGLMEFVVPFLRTYFGGRNDADDIDGSSGSSMSNSSNLHDEFIPLLITSISCTCGLIGCWALSFWVLCRYHDHDQ